ncbi:PCNA-associated factor-like [Hylaeus volcanicus]|uniref:PCNA-associated factor-like n=1 Tax=Hylaeus volcanicus TaxID=313075 RepID=UPI0023B7FA55|nr:PCNA-associated factor-like [Hylaeus volcanicus]
MVRTKGDRVPSKAVGAKAPRKIASTSQKKGGLGSKGGGNPYHPRETPEWQKPITWFLNQNSEKQDTGSSEAQESEDQNANEEAGNESD